MLPDSPAYAANVSQKEMSTSLLRLMRLHTTKKTKTMPTKYQTSRQKLVRMRTGLQELKDKQIKSKNK